MSVSIEQQLQPDVTAAITGDMQAFSRLVQRCQNGISSIALAIVKDLDASENERSRLLRYRNQALVWVGLCGLMLAAAYEFTAGAIVPVLAFGLFMAGVAYLQLRVWQTIKPRLLAKALQSAAAKRQYRNNLFWCWFGMLGGATAGFAGLIAGLIKNGRWFWG
jgi:hypothetical protein